MLCCIVDIMLFLFCFVLCCIVDNLKKKKKIKKKLKKNKKYIYIYLHIYTMCGSAHCMFLFKDLCIKQNSSILYSRTSVIQHLDNPTFSDYNKKHSII